MNRTSIITSMLIACLLIAEGTMAQSKREIEANIPVLGNHRFINNKLLFGAWSNSSFELYAGYGESKSLPALEILLGDTTLRVSDGSMAVATLGVAYEQKIKEWLSLYLLINGDARIGLDTRGLLTQGLNTYYGYQIGWKIKIWADEKNRLSGRLGIYSYEGNFINVYQYVLDIIDRKPDPSLSKDIPALQTLFGIMYARSLGSLVGFQFEATGGLGDTFIREDNSTDFSYQVSGAFDLNLYPKTNVPLGVSFGFSVSSLPDLALQNSGSVPMFNYKIVYTGTPDFFLSFDFMTFNLPYFFGTEDRVGSVETKNASINVKYYFN